MSWNVKPIFGLVMDTVPILGYHFRPYLVRLLARIPGPGVRRARVTLQTPGDPEIRREHELPVQTGGAAAARHDQGA